MFPIWDPLPGIKLITPSGRPASLSISIIKYPDNTAVVAGFHTMVLPIMAGAVHKLPAMAVKLKGLNANINPSRGRYSSLFHTPFSDLG